jgi:hypothetical protein
LVLLFLHDVLSVEGIPAVAVIPATVSNPLLLSAVPGVPYFTNILAVTCNLAASVEVLAAVAVPLVSALPGVQAFLCSYCCKRFGFACIPAVASFLFVFDVPAVAVISAIANILIIASFSDAVVVTSFAGITSLAANPCYCLQPCC